MIFRMQLKLYEVIVKNKPAATSKSGEKRFINVTLNVSRTMLQRRNYSYVSIRH